MTGTHPRGIVYGTVCAQWDAPDERHWCVVERGACGDETFFSEGSDAVGQPRVAPYYWSHKPCKGMGKSHSVVKGSAEKTKGSAAGLRQSKYSKAGRKLP